MKGCIAVNITFDNYLRKLYIIVNTKSINKYYLYKKYVDILNF
ncbi:hypothetical protein HMPREF0379_1228 [[Eubacterium] yurii subsp. margaretiae ATCC 43715]|nr:hypothetical protein HMPREF0379_1228 [[Eubacterium] yurii subsp. margaretiae ATCC 43715]